VPSKSKSQQRLFGAALAAKRSGNPSFPLAGKLAKQMSENQLKDFATKPVVKPPNTKGMTKKLKSYL
jgi:hypothetical protein